MAKAPWDDDVEVSLAAPAPSGGVSIGAPIFSNPKSPAAQTGTQAEIDAARLEEMRNPKPNVPTGYRLRPDGTAERIPGVPLPGEDGPGDPKLQEAERTAAFLTTRLAGGIKDLNTALAGDQSAAKPGVFPSFLGNFSEAAQRWASSPSRKQVEDAQLEVLDSALTLGTGAAYTREQLENYRQTYFPSLNDDEATIKAKRTRVLRLLQAAKLKAGNAAPQIDAIIGQLDPEQQLAEEDAKVITPTGAGGTAYRLEDLPPPPGPLRPDFDPDTDLAVPEGEVFRGWNLRNGVATPSFGAPQQREQMGGFGQTLDAGVRGLADTATFGFADEISAIADTIFEGGTYNKNLIEQRAVDGYDQENNFGARLTGQVAGGFALPSGLRAVVEKEMASVLARGGTKAEAITAARAAVVPQLAKEGATYGGAYGAGSADGGFTDRAIGAGVGVAVGGAAGAGIAKAGGRILVPGGAGQAASGSADQVASAQAAGDLGIDLPGFVAGNAGAQNMGASLGRSPGGAKPISEATERMLEQAQAASDNIAASVGTASDPEAMGTAAVNAGKKSIKDSRARIGRQYDQARAAAANQPVEAKATGALLGQIVQQEGETLGGTAVGRIMTELRDDLQERGGTLTVDGARSTRTELRRRLTKEAELSPDNAERLTDMVMKAVGQDIDAGLNAAGKGNAVPLYRQADRAWAEQLKLEDDVIKPFIGKDGDNWGDDAARNIMRDVKANGPRIAQYLRAIEPAEADNIRATLITNLGKASDGQQNAAGSAWSLDVFLTNWNKISGARNLIFPKETVQSLDKLAKVAERVKSTGKQRPPSGAAIWGAAMASPTAIGGGISLTTGDPKAFTYGAMASALMVGGQRSAAKWLSSPKLAQKLAATPLNPKAAQQYWSRPWVANMAKAQPAIANDLLGFQQAFLGNVTAKAAASDSAEKDQNKQR